jgi:hypothetical protein
VPQAGQPGNTIAARRSPTLALTLPLALALALALALKA